MSKDPDQMVTVLLPRGRHDTIESIESKRPPEYPRGLYDLLLNDEPGRMLIDFTQFEYTEENEHHLIATIRAALARHHRKPLNDNDCV